MKLIVLVLCGSTLIKHVHLKEATATASPIKDDVLDTPNSSTNSTRTSGDITKAKCMEYANYSYKSFLPPLLTIKPEYQKIYECHLTSEILTVTTVDATIEQFPHMAHIGYENNFFGKTEIQYGCSGSLISENFVLTVAHCVKSAWSKPPVLVRCGVTSVEDTYHLQTINIAEHYTHPKHYKLYHDIGLLKLEKPVEMNQFVRPACLNTIRDINYKTGVVSGWGATVYGGAPSKHLLKSILNIRYNNNCDQIYKAEDGNVEEWVICAAVTSKQRTNPCQGMSGSPLQVRMEQPKALQCMSLIFGITAFAVNCENIGAPVGYTRVSTYIDWIEQIVWSENNTVKI